MMEQFIGLACHMELHTLSECLPSVEEMNAAARKPMCHDWINRCTVGSLMHGGMPSIGITLPTPLWAPPLNDICINYANETDFHFEHVPAKLEAFQDACIPHEDRQVWNNKVVRMFGEKSN